MPPSGIAVILAFIAGVNAAPESSEILPWRVLSSLLDTSSNGSKGLILNETAIDSVEKTAYEDILSIIGSSGDPLAGKNEIFTPEFRDIIVKTLNGTKPRLQDLKGLQLLLKQLRGTQNEHHETDNNSSKPADGKKGELDRGFVSDLIESTLSGVKLGLSLGNTNGTTNQLCIKLGNISMGGCERKTEQNGNISLNNTVEIPLEQNTTDFANE